MGKNGGETMRYVKWTVWALLILMVFGFFHYTLPQHDVVRITETYEKRIDFGGNSIFWAGPDAGNAASVNRDVFFFQTIRPNGKPMVYRNEDTGWGWPPYFKFSTSNLQTEAADLKSVKENPQWVMITHYGWRNDLISIYPNAVAVRPVSGPDVRIVPWLNMVILSALAIAVIVLWRKWRRFRARSIDPVMDDIGEATDSARSRVSGVISRLTSGLRRQIRK
jgi:hypothetical protein